MSNLKKNTASLNYPHVFCLKHTTPIATMILLMSASTASNVVLFITFQNQRMLGVYMWVLNLRNFQLWNAIPMLRSWLCWKNSVSGLIAPHRYGFNTLRPRLNGRHFADDIFKCIFLNENAWFAIKISLKFVPQGPITNIPALNQIMAWRRPGDKPLSEPMMVSLPTHICVTRPQWVKTRRQHSA